MMVAILVGGFGKRLRPYTEEVPKPLVPVAGKPILEWQILWLKKYGFDEFVLLVGYRKEKIIEYIGSGSRLGVKVTYVVEDEPLGTGGALKNAEHILSREDVFIALNGDIVTNLNPLKLVETVKKAGYAAVLAAIPLPSPYGVLEIRGDRIVGFHEKPKLSDYWINAGVYAMTPEVFKYLPEKGDIERTAFPKMAEAGKLGAVKYTEIFWKSIDTHKDLEEASREIQKLGEL
ncbi:nucleotidyltransferase family protein [Desulfurococcaceae archaeon MEX13E-LK6-19]|nr:nucleotidyltransferase family protein [Desulfurococcaceae archaeon MEX13E-LK6-19]